MFESLSFSNPKVQTKTFSARPSNSKWKACSPFTMLYLVGLGLGDARDITVRGLEIVKRCDKVFLEAYTSILTCGKEELEKFYGREVRLADRELVEQGADEILDGAKDSDVALLVVGDPFGATTHSDLVLRARQRGIPHRAVHNASIMNAVGCVGLQLYNYGETVSVPFWADGWEPESFYDKIADNLRIGRHTLCLLDIKVKEQTVENMIKGRKVFEPPRFMTVAQAAKQLLAIAERRKNKKDDDGDDEDSCGGNKVAYCQALDGETRCVGVARVGAEDQLLLTGSLAELAESDLGGPLHSLVIPGKMHFLEEEAINMHLKR